MCACYYTFALVQSCWCIIMWFSVGRQGFQSYEIIEGSMFYGRLMRPFIFMQALLRTIHRHTLEKAHLTSPSSTSDFPCGRGAVPSTSRISKYLIDSSAKNRDKEVKSWSTFLSELWTRRLVKVIWGGRYFSADLSLKKRRKPNATSFKTDSRTKMRVKT